MKTYNYILREWLNSKNNLKIQSYQRYEAIINKHISNSIGIYNIKDINVNTINNYINYLHKNNLSISTIKNILYIIKSSINFSYNNKYSKYIDLKDIKIKSINKSTYILSKSDQIIIEKYLKNNINIKSICVLLCLYTGIRIGEVCGLKWNDINFNTKSINIKRTIIRIKNTSGKNKTILTTSTPKSSTSVRTIPIPNFIINLLFFYKSNNNYYLLSSSNKLYDPRLMEYYYKKILIKNNININKFHTLRHTFATRSIESKMDIKTLSEILGHSSIEMTLKLYVHPSFELKKNSIENLVSFMNS